MTKFNAIQFVAHASVDVNGEIDDLAEMLEAGAEKVEEIRMQYRHLNSLVQGMEYTVEFIQDDETREEVLQLITDLKETLISLYPRCAEISFSQRTGKTIKISTTYHANKEKTYQVTIGEETTDCPTFDKLNQYLKSLTAIK